MPANTPFWWYPSDNPHSASDNAFGNASGQLIPWILSPASALYGAVSAYRMCQDPGYISALPVVCVGNFTAGGTGKTPVAINVASRLKALGARPAFLTRGYGGTLNGPYEVNPDRDTAERTGDEPLLLARTAPTIIARDRVMGARHIERSDATVIIMDDGMQNPAIAKSLTIAVVDAVRGVGNGWTIPSGPLRAPLVRQQKLPDAVILNGKGTESQVSQASPQSAPLLRGELCPLDDKYELRGTPVIAFSGIGNPDRFYTTLESCGADIVSKFVFPDHHAFTEQNAKQILVAADKSGASIITTEKDIVRLKHAPNGSTRMQLFKQSYALPVTFKLRDADSARLDAMLDMLVRQNTAR